MGEALDSNSFCSLSLPKGLESRITIGVMVKSAIRAETNPIEASRPMRNMALTGENVYMAKEAANIIVVMVRVFPTT